LEASECRTGRVAAYNRHVTPRLLLAALGVLFAVLVLAGCGGSQPAPRSADPAKLHVRQECVAGSLYIEGSYSYVRVEQDEKKVVQVRLKGRKTLETTVRLEPGSYRLVSFQRPCDGNCGYLDPPTDECSGGIEAKAGGLVEATVRLSPGEGCTIDADA
jgi:hypothetical protein